MLAANHDNRVLLVFTFIGLVACASTQGWIPPQAVIKQCGNPGPSLVISKDPSVSLSYSKLVSGSASLSTTTKEEDVISQLQRDDSSLVYLGCATPIMDNYTPEQKDYEEQFVKFLRGVPRPTAAQISDWQKLNPFPVSNARSDAGTSLPATSQPDLQCNVKDDPFLRGYCVNTTCKQAVSVRGKATLYRKLHQLELAIGAESDSTEYGVSGFVKYYLKDSAGSVIAWGRTGSATCSAKFPGSSHICNWPPEKVAIPDSIVQLPTELDVEPTCTGTPFGPFGINYDQAGKDLLEIVKK